MTQISLAKFANFNSAVPWGLWVAVYIWLVGISAGSFLLVMWGNLKNNAHLKKITHLTLALALSTLTAGLLSILIDLGHIERFYKLFISPSPASAMAWMVWLYGIYFVILAALILWVKLRKNISRPILTFSLFYALAIIVVESLLFALPPGKHWHSIMFIVHFVTSSLAAAIGCLLFVIGIMWPKSERIELINGLARIALPIIIADFLVELIDVVLLGELTHTGALLLLSMHVIAIVLLLTRNALVITLAGFIEFISILFYKYNVVVSAQIVEPFKGFAASYIEPRLQYSYSPTAFEYVAADLLIALAILMFYILYKRLPLTREG